MPIVPCPPNTPITRGVVTFDATAFKTLYPRFVTVADAALIRNFAWAQILLKNTCCSRVVNAVIRETLLNLLVAHITQLFDGIDGKPPSGAVGRVADATEGSVSVSLDYGELAPGEAWYVQTSFGAMFWTMTGSYRTFVYVPAPADCAGFPVGFGHDFPFGGGGCG